MQYDIIVHVLILYYYIPSITWDKFSGVVMTPGDQEDRNHCGYISVNRFSILC